MTQTQRAAEKNDAHDTVTRILMAAEVLFVEHGFDGTSLRMITSDAGVNLAAVNYHFGSKENLLKSVVLRRLLPWAAACSEALDTLEKSGRELSVENLVHTFMLPSLEMSRDPKCGGALFARLLSRTFIENHKLLRETILSQNHAFVERYHAAFAKALPSLLPEDLAWRLHFSFSLMFHTLAGNDALKVFVPQPSLVSTKDPDLIAQYLIPFVVAGLTSQV